MKKFEPRYRLVRVGMAEKIERASRQQSKSGILVFLFAVCSPICFTDTVELTIWCYVMFYFTQSKLPIKNNRSQHNLIAELHSDILFLTQGNNVKTGRRNLEAPPRLRVLQKIKRNRRVVTLHQFVCSCIARYQGLLRDDFILFYFFFSFFFFLFCVLVGRII